jgi:hypothetical protein
MRYRIAKTIAAAAIGVVLLTASTVPMVRHIASGWWNNPEAFPALPEDPRVHYESGGSEYARTVAGLLPTAMARVESIHGRPFGHSVSVGVYVSQETFVAATGTGSWRSVGYTFLGRVALSPVLFSSQSGRLAVMLTHELSHAHLRSWISQLSVMYLPQWFKEGLAVVVSDGGGAEGVSELQARDAIRRGDYIDIKSFSSLFNFGVVRFAQPPEIPDTSFRIQMAYRQAGMFVTFLRETNPVGFARMMNAILDDRPFAEAVTAGYETDLQTLWLRFVQAAPTPQ